MSAGLPTIVLMGLRGSGKSTAGEALAHRLGRPFIDLDDVTAESLGHPSVRAAWDALGEPAFRAAEADALARTLSHPNAVIALGGGTPTAPGAADLLERAARAGTTRLIYLRAEATLLRARLAAGADAALVNRPSLTGRDPLEEIEVVMALRDPLYSRIATNIIDAQGTIRDVVERIIAALAT